MAEYCEDGCFDICDFCSYYRAENGFCGEGLCVKHNKKVDAADDCEDFRCFRLDKIKE
jgi:hypothetical protein